MSSGERGHSLIALLVATALVALAASVAAPSVAWQRQHEQEARFGQIGRAYAQALARYRRLSPGAQPAYPHSLDDLLLDRRFVGTVRHLRRLYPDPLAAGQPWVPLRDERGGIVGVRSQSQSAPLATQPPPGARWLSQPPVPGSGRRAPTYADWAFLAEEAP